MAKSFKIDNYNITFYDLKTYEKKMSGGMFFKKKLEIEQIKYTSGKQEIIPENKIIPHESFANVVNDFKINVYKEIGLCGSSVARGIGFIVNDFRVMCNVNAIDARQKMIEISKMFTEADKEWKPESQENIDNGEYIGLLREIWSKKVSDFINEKSIEEKRKAKNEAKKLIRYKYRIGDLYSPRYRTLSGDKISDDVYQIKKVIHSIGSTIVNILIMKKIVGDYDYDVSRHMLTVNDCKIFHIKYEPGLLVFNMNERLYKVDNLNKKLLYAK